VLKFNRVFILVRLELLNDPENCPVLLLYPEVQITIARLASTFDVSPVANEKLVSDVVSVPVFVTSIGDSD
jgi:hypothetical protein